MHPTCRLAALLCCAICLSVPAFATERAQSVIDKIATAYGGEKLTTLKSLIVHDRYKTIAKDGGRAPGLDAISRLHSTLTVDFDKGRKAVRNWSVTARGKRLGQIMFDGEHGWSINYLRGSHVIRQDLNHNNVGAGMMRLLDTTVVRLLIEARDTATYQGTQTLFGRTHDKLSFKINGTLDVTLLVDNSTGLISQMSRSNGVKYVYSDHRKTNGLTYAADTNQFRNGSAVMVTLSRSIEVNPDVSKAFEIPASTKALEGMQDTTKMTVKSLSENVYIAAKGNRSSLFIDAGDYFVAAGMLSGFKQRLQAVNDKLATNKPVKYMVISEHQGHMSGLKEVAAMGASFITVAQHLPLVQTRLADPLPEERFVLVDGSLTLANGKAQVHDISTVMSDQLLVLYVPAAKLIFSMDEFGTNLLNSVPSADKRTISFRQSIEALGVDVENFTYVHGTGVLTMVQLKQVTDAYKEGFCPDGFEICK